MINEQELFSKIHIMPENMKSQIFDYVEFLVNKYKLQQEQKKIIPKFDSNKTHDFDKSLEVQEERKIFGKLKGFVKYIADDFDEPLDDFKEYMY
ncbi:MAG: DUF2281 domain-containing protein [Cyanobacteriota bacterium]